MRQAVRLLYWAGFLAGAAVTLVGLIAPLKPQWELVNHFRPFTLLGCLGLIALGSFAWPKLWPKAAIALASVNLCLVAPAVLMTASSAKETPGESIKVLSLNLWVSEDTEAVLRLIERVQPDLVMFQEVRDTHVANLFPRLREHFPHVAQSLYDVAIASRRPLKDVEYELHTSERPAIISALWTSVSGRTYRIASIHLAWPFRGETQAEHIHWLIGTLRTWNEPIILAGDFNLTPFSYKMTLLTWQTGLRRHGLVGFSWPSQDFDPLPPMVLIDNVLTSPEIRSSKFRVEEDVSSDHRPVSVTLAPL